MKTSGCGICGGVGRILSATGETGIECAYCTVCTKCKRRLSNSSFPNVLHSPICYDCLDVHQVEEEDFDLYPDCPNCGGLGVDANLHICKKCEGTGTRL